MTLEMSGVGLGDGWVRGEGGGGAELDCMAIEMACA